MNTEVFPINYFKSIWTPIQAFKRRHALNWFQIILVIFFLIALILIPVSLNYASVGTTPLEDYYPNALELIDQEVVDEVSQYEYENGEMLMDESFIIEMDDGIVAGGLSEEDWQPYSETDTFLLFEKNQFLVRDENIATTSVLYTNDFSLEGMDNPEEIKNELSRQWDSQNNVIMVLVFSLMIGVFLLIMSVLLILGSAFILYLTRTGSVTSITTYKESVNLMVNLLSLPTILSMLLGIFYFDIYLMVAVQTLGLLIMLIILFYQTQFNDSRLAERVEEKEVEEQSNIEE